MLKVGDKVRYVGGAYQALEVGATGVITEVYDDDDQYLYQAEFVGWPSDEPRPALFLEDELEPAE